MVVTTGDFEYRIAEWPKLESMTEFFPTLNLWTWTPKRNSRKRRTLKQILTSYMHKGEHRR